MFTGESRSGYESYVWTSKLMASSQRAIDANQPLSVLLDQARLENPLDEAVQLEGGGYGAPGSEP